MKKIILLCFIIFAQPVWSLNFSIAPTKFEADLSKTTYHEAYLINNTAQPLRIEVYTEAPKSYENYNLNKEITIFPKIISIKPASKQEIRFRVKPPENMKDGEYRSLLVFREVPGKIKKTISIKSQNLEMETELTMITEAAVSVFGETGDVSVKGEIKNFKHSLKDGRLYMTADVLSEGNTSLKIDYIIKNGNKKIAQGKFGNSLRMGENKISKEILFDTLGLDLKKLKIILQEQKGRILYEKNLTGA